MHFVSAHLSRGRDRTVPDIIVLIDVLEGDFKVASHQVVVDICEAATAASMLGRSAFLREKSSVQRRPSYIELLEVSSL